MLDARGSLRYSSWSSRADTLCPSCWLENVRFLGETPLLIWRDTSMFTAADRPRFSFERAGQSRPCERAKGPILRSGYLRLVGQFTVAMQKLLTPLSTVFGSSSSYPVNERQLPVVEIQYGGPLFQVFFPIHSGRVYCFFGFLAFCFCLLFVFCLFVLLLFCFSAFLLLCFALLGNH